MKKALHHLAATGLVAAVLLAMTPSVYAADVDVDAAKALAKQNNCLKCHAIDKDKDGPSFKSVAAKFKGNADAEAKLMNHLTTGEKAKFPDGHEEDHENRNQPVAVKQVALLDRVARQERHAVRDVAFLTL